MKSGKYMGLNVANIKSHKTFEDDTVRLAVEEGFEHTDTYKLQLSSQESGAKYELTCVYIQKTLKSLDTIYRGINNQLRRSRPAENLRFKGNYNDILKSLIYQR